MNCDSVGAGFYFWLGKILAEATVAGICIIAICLFVLVSYVLTKGKKP